jgi:hypothetical protein
MQKEVLVIIIQRLVHHTGVILMYTFMLQVEGYCKSYHLLKKAWKIIFVQTREVIKCQLLKKGVLIMSLKGYLDSL